MSERWRTLGLALFLFGAVGVGLELVLLEHHEDAKQWAPLTLLAVGTIVGAVLLVRPSKSAVRLFQGVMGAYLVSALLGIYFHLKANLEFELELRPSMAGGELVLESLRGALPALAPGAMAQLGLLGLLVAYHHPASKRTTGGSTAHPEGD